MIYFPNSRMNRRQPSFGSFFGQHTLADCDNLIANYSKWIPELMTQFIAVRDAWLKSDPVAATQYRADIKGLVDRWTAAVANFNATSNGATMNRLIGARDYGVDEDDYIALVKAVRQGGGAIDDNGNPIVDGVPTQPGDFTDLTTRLSDYMRTAAAATNTVVKPATYTPAIQPKIDSDSKFQAQIPNGPWGAIQAVVTTRDPNTGERTYDTWFKWLAGILGVFGVAYVGNTAINVKREFFPRRSQ